MDRRKLILAGAAMGAPAFGMKALAQTALPPARPARDESPPDYSQSSSSPSDGQYQPPAQDQPPAQYQEPARDYAQGGPASPAPQPQYPARAETYSRDEIVNSVSDFLGVTAEAAGAAIERIFRERGRPTGYIAGEEGAGAFVVGLRYGKGILYMKNRPTTTVYWRGPSIGWDFGGNGSRTFTLCYSLQEPDRIFQRYPGVEGSAYLIGGLGVNYQQADDIVLAPMRAGVGLRLGANIGYPAYSRQRRLVPL
jgi:hypothetical protein